MLPPQDQLLDLLRAIHARPGGTGAVLNLIRAFKVRGAADLNALSDLVTIPQLKLDLTRHAAEEATHAYTILQRMHEIRCKPTRLPPSLDRVDVLLAGSRARDVKRVYADRGTVGDAEVMEILAAALVLERDAFAKMRANYQVLGKDPRTQALIGSILVDEDRHVQYLHTWLDHFERRFSDRAVERTLARLEEVFERSALGYYGALGEYLERVAAACIAA